MGGKKFLCEICVKKETKQIVFCINNFCHHKMKFKFHPLHIHLQVHFSSEFHSFFSMLKRTYGIFFLFLFILFSLTHSTLSQNENYHTECMYDDGI